MNKEWYDEEIARVQRELTACEPGSEEYKEKAECLGLLLKQRNDIENTENRYNLDCWRQMHEDSVTKRDNIKFAVQTAAGLGLGIMTVFAEETRAVTSKAANVVKNLFTFR